MSYSKIIKISLIFSWCLTLGWTEWKLEWNEEFEGEEINKTRWNVENEVGNCNGDQ